MAGMERLIPVINKLQDVLAAANTKFELSLPSIVVVGSQSSGKSSVLESIIGRECLPRGTGIVTRRPLILQLFHDPNPEGQPWAVFNHQPDQRFTDFDAIREEIAAETERLVGDNKGISVHPIILKLTSPDVLTLTLVDLPGLTKVPVGDQPDDIEVQIREMVLSFIESEQSLILAVSPANADIANSDALQLAKHVDPEGRRTIGVLTKLDLMDKGTNALPVLDNRVYKLKLGYIGVVNRSQADIEAAVPVAEAREAERLFFAQHPAYRSVAHRMGVEFLSKTLNRLLMEHIGAYLPLLISKVNSSITKLQGKIQALGAPLDEQTALGSTILEAITRFASDFEAALDGSMASVSTSSLSGGARISYIFAETYMQALDNIDPLNGITEEEIRNSIFNATGLRGGMFVPEASFELLAKRSLQMLEEPAVQCVDVVYRELCTLIDVYNTRELQRFTVLREELKRTVHQVLSDCRDPTVELVRFLIQSELAYINTRHPDFVAVMAGETGIVGTSTYASRSNNNNSGHREEEESAGREAEGRSGDRGRSGSSSTHRRTRDRGKDRRDRSRTQGRGAEAAPAQAAPEPEPVVEKKSGGFFSFFGGGSKKNSSGSSGTKAEPAPLVAPPERLSAGGSTTAGGSGRGGSSNPESRETVLIRRMLHTYFEIIKVKIGDLVPKTIMCELVNATVARVQSELVRALYKPELLEDLLEEPEELKIKRRTANERLKVLKQAARILREVRDYDQLAAAGGGGSTSTF